MNLIALSKLLKQEADIPMEFTKCGFKIIGSIKNLVTFFLVYRNSCWYLVTNNAKFSKETFILSLDSLLFWSHCMIYEQ